MIKPTGWTVLVKVDEQEEEKGGIILADIAKDRPMYGRVVELGTGIVSSENEPLPFDVEVGNRVLIPQFGGTDVNDNGEDLRLVKHEDIIGVLENE